MSHITSLTTEHTPSLTKRRHARAHRLLNTRSSIWLAIRQKGIGASDAAAADGLNPYKSQLEIWMEKQEDLTINQIMANQEEARLKSIAYNKSWVSIAKHSLPPVALPGNERPIHKASI